MTEVLLLLAGVILGVGLAVFVSQQRQVSVIARPSDPSPDETSNGAVDPTAWKVLDQVAEGVLLLDDRLRPIFANAAARGILGLRGGQLPTRLPSEEVVVIAQRAREEGVEMEELLTLWFPAKTVIKSRAMPMDEEMTVVLLQDVTEESLAQQVRREFVAHASHELKSPVAGLQALAEAILQAAEDDPDAVGHFSHKLVDEATRLGRLISDLLDLSRLEDPVVLPEEPTDLGEVAHREIAQARVAAEIKSISLNARLTPDVWVLGDGQQLGLMMRNLLENAIRYTPEGGSITLELDSVGGSAIVVVSDTGIGIPLEAQRRVFERFYRVDRARSRDKGGTGLGLAIVKHVAELHGGAVEVSSELGVGSTFTVHIPASRPEPETRPLAG